MKDNRRKTHSQRRAPWKSLEQLAESWGLSRARTDLVVKALIRSGRMEERPVSESETVRRQYRLVGR